MDLICRFVVGFMDGWIEKVNILFDQNTFTIKNIYVFVIVH